MYGSMPIIFATKNNRLAYIEAFWHVINWGFIEKRFIQETTL